MYNIDPVNGWVEAFLMWGGCFIDGMGGFIDGLRDGHMDGGLGTVTVK